MCVRVRSTNSRTIKIGGGEGRRVSSRKWQLMSSNRSENIEPCGFEADLINPPGSNASFRPLRTITRVPRTMPVRLRTEQNQTFAFPPASIILNWYQVELTWLIFTSLVFDRVNSVKLRVAIHDNAMLALDFLFLLYFYFYFFFFFEGEQESKTIHLTSVVGTPPKGWTKTDWTCTDPIRR